MSTYRIELWTREGQILRAEYVDENGDPFTLRTALADVAEIRRLSQIHDVRLATGDGEPVDEIAALDATDPARIANRWLRETMADSIPVKLSSGEEIAACLRLVADRVEDLGPLASSHLSIQLQATEHERDEDLRRATVDAIAIRLGHSAQPSPMGNGSWHYSTQHRDDSARAVGIFTSMKAPEPDETELVARAALQPDTLPDVVPVDEQAPAGAVATALELHEPRCLCGQPWALIISGNAKHADDCPELNVSVEAGETEDALGVPGLTSDEANDFMSGGAR